MSSTAVVQIALGSANAALAKLIVPGLQPSQSDIIATLKSVVDALTALAAEQDSALQATIDQNVSLYVSRTRKVNGHALSADVDVTKGDVGLGNVTNDAQIKVADKNVANGVFGLDSFAMADPGRIAFVGYTAAIATTISQEVDSGAVLYLFAVQADGKGEDSTLYDLTVQTNDFNNESISYTLASIDVSGKTMVCGLFYASSIITVSFDCSASKGSISLTIYRL